MKFNQIPGQNKLKNELLHGFHTGNVAQAYLFIGKDGKGGLPLALAFAQLLNCENPQENDSCGSCNACLKSEKLIHPDIHYSFPVIKKGNNPPISNEFITEFRAFVHENAFATERDFVKSISNEENKQGNITAEECRHIIKTLNLKKSEGKKKIQIIWRADYLDKSSNILLKIIEEPPENTVFILIAEDTESLLPTLISRCRIMKLANYGTEELEQLLLQNGASEAVAKHTAALAEGNYYKATQLLSNNQLTYNAFCLLLFKACMRKSFYRSRNRQAEEQQAIAEIMSCVGEIEKLGKENLKEFVANCQYFTRQLYLNKTVGESDLNAEELKFATSTKHLGDEAFIQIADLFNNLHFYIERNANMKLQLLAAAIEMSEIFIGNLKRELV